MSSQIRLKQIIGNTVSSIPFIGPGGVLSENSSNFFWDNTNNILGVGSFGQISSSNIFSGGELNLYGVQRVIIDTSYSDAIIGTKGKGLFIDAHTGTPTGNYLGIYGNGASGYGSKFYTFDQSTGETGFESYFGLTNTPGDSNFVHHFVNGFVGIGTLTPTAKLHISTDAISSNFGLKVQDSIGTNLLTVRNDSFVGIGTNDPGYSYAGFTVKNGGAAGMWVDFTDPASSANLTFRTDGNIPTGVSLISGPWYQNNSQIFMDGASRKISLNGYPYTAQAVNIMLNAYNAFTGERFAIGGGNHDINTGSNIWFYGAPTVGSNSQSPYASIEALKENSTDGDAKAYLKFSINTGITIAEVLRITSDKTIQYQDGNQGAGKVLTSDANGVATWQTPSGGGTSIAKASRTFTPGTAGTVNTLSHGLGTADIIVQLWDVVTGQVIYADISNATSSQVDITFSVNPSGDVKAIIIG